MRLSSVVVFITSNYVGNSELMQGCKEAGIPAFGTLWDFVSVTVFVRLLLDERPRSERRSAGVSFTLFVPSGTFLFHSVVNL